jgi:Lsr2
MGVRVVRETTVEMIDDLDGSPAVTTVLFGLDGRHFEVDLNEKNDAKLRRALAPFVSAARPVGQRPSRRRRSEIAASSDTIRRWARANGHDVSDRGRISVSIQEAFTAANNG